MDAIKLGVAPAGGEAPVEKQPAEPIKPEEHSLEKPGTDGKDTPKPPGKKTEPSEPVHELASLNEIIRKGNAGETLEGEDKRIYDLMSKWQSEEAGHNKTRTKLQLYEEKYGPLDGDGKPDPKAKQRAAPTLPDDDQDMPEALKPGWNPKTMEELQEGLKQAAIYGATLAGRDVRQEQVTRQEAEQQLDNFVAEIKATDSEFDDKVFFQYATEYGFPVNSVNDLRAVYRSYVALERAKRGAVEIALKNKDQRKNPVNKPGSGTGDGSGVPFSKISQATSAKDLISDMISRQGK